MLNYKPDGWKKIWFVSKDDLQVRGITGAPGTTYAGFLEFQPGEIITDFVTGHTIGNAVQAWNVRILDDSGMRYSNNDDNQSLLGHVANLGPPSIEKAPRFWREINARTRFDFLFTKSTLAGPPDPPPTNPLFLSACVLTPWPSPWTDRNDPKWWQQWRFWPWFQTVDLVFAPGQNAVYTSFPARNEIFIQGISRFGKFLTPLPDIFIKINNQNEQTGPGLTNIAQNIDIVCANISLLAGNQIWPGLYPLPVNQFLNIFASRSDVATEETISITFHGYQLRVQS